MVIFHAVLIHTLHGLIDTAIGETTSTILGAGFLKNNDLIIDLKAGKVYNDKVELNLVQSASEAPTVLHLKYLENTEKESIINLLAEFPDVVTDKLGKTNVLTHKIELSDHELIRQNARRTLLAKAKVIRDEIAKLLELGLIQESDSPYSSPVVVVPKPDGSRRVCVDYRKLNKQLKLIRTALTNRT